MTETEQLELLRKKYRELYNLTTELVEADSNVKAAAMKVIEARKTSVDQNFLFRLEGNRAHALGAFQGTLHDTVNFLKENAPK